MAESKRKNLSVTFKDAVETDAKEKNDKVDQFNFLVDKDFKEFRKQFDMEIRKVEEEMARFRSEVLDKDGKFLLSALLSKNKTEKKIPDSKTKKDSISSTRPSLIQQDGKNNPKKLGYAAHQSSLGDKLSAPTEPKK